jgi:hypothetical protein
MDDVPTPDRGSDGVIRELGFEPFGLFARKDGQIILAAIAAIRCQGPARPAIPLPLREAIGAVLSQRDDIDAVICLG